MSALEEAKLAWATQYAGLSRREIDERMRGFEALVRGIAREGVVTVERFAELMGFEGSKAAVFFAGFSAAGMQTDEGGAILGAALTTRETPHTLRVAGKELYAWCALDTLFIPGLLGETVQVESTCPDSSEPIRLRVSPRRVEACEPSGTWLSIFLPGGSARHTGPTSPT